MRFRGRHPLEKDRHGPGAHLIIGNGSRGETGDQIADFFLSQLLTVTLLFDETWDMHSGILLAISVPRYKPLGLCGGRVFSRLLPAGHDSGRFSSREVRIAH